ncbi:hypothetical protein, partial [Kosakonia cowanii]|uniref:hypothetical protein n=1 Tax=Kosakonia cowanii TaxID=208223 RepID=UPI0040635619
TFESCTTPHTTYVPDGVGGQYCLPGLGTTLHWRVKALDLPKNVQGYYSPIQRFVYARPQVQKSSPADGATVDRPQLTWQPLAGAQRYRVTLSWTGGEGGELVGTTYSTSWAPHELLPDDAGENFSWTVQAIDHNSVTTPLTIGGGAWRFRLVPTGDDPGIA